MVATYFPAGNRMNIKGRAQSMLAVREPSEREMVTTPLPSARESSPLIHRRMGYVMPEPNVAGRIQAAVLVW